MTPARRKDAETVRLSEARRRSMWLAAFVGDPTGTSHGTHQFHSQRWSQPLWMSERSFAP